MIWMRKHLREKIQRNCNEQIFDCEGGPIRTTLFFMTFSYEVRESVLLALSITCKKIRVSSGISVVVVFRVFILERM